jgi:hypothetical protein
MNARTQRRKAERANVEDLVDRLTHAVRRGFTPSEVRLRGELRQALERLQEACWSEVMDDPGDTDPGDSYQGSVAHVTGHGARH